MERKIGEVFTYKGKTYLIVPRDKEDCCIGCAFDLGKYACKKPRNESRNNFGHCYFRFREDKKGIIFKEIKSMEIKNNQLTIDIPEGIEIDTKNSNLAKGIIKFKPKYITYNDIVNSANSIDSISALVQSDNMLKLKAIEQLMYIARYYNKDWESNWNNREEKKYFIIWNNECKTYWTDYNRNSGLSVVYFKNKEDAQSVIDNPNFREILDTIYK